MHAAGKGYPDLVRMRAGQPEGAPDAVVLTRGPRADQRDARAVRKRFARGRAVRRRNERRRRLAPLRGEHAGVVSLDMGRMGAVLRLDRDSATVTVQGGMRAPAL